MELKKGYKQTEVGVIPEDWQECPLKDLVIISSGESPSLFEFHNEGVPYFKVEQLNNSNKYACETEYHINSTKKIKKGSIVFPKRGASIFLNKIRILLCDSFMDTNLMTLTPVDSLNNEYLFYQLSYIGLSKIADVTSIPQINNKHINPFKIPFPIDEIEQSAIANALSNIDELISQTENLIQKKKMIKQGVMQELFKPKEGWVMKKLGDYGRTYGGITGKGKSDFGNGTAHYIPFMNIMNNCTIDLNYLEKVNILDGEFQNKVQCGDIFFNGSSETPEDVGLCSVLQTEIDNVFLNSFCFGYRMYKKDELNGYFLSYLFRSPLGRSLIFSLAQGATRYNLSKTNLLKLELPIPSKEEQDTIAEVLIDIDNDIECLHMKLQKVKYQKKGMMQALLTGKIRLI